MRGGCAAILPGSLPISASRRSTDRLGNLIATLEGDAGAPSVMLFTHMDQLGFVVRKIEADGFIRIERLGGVPERALPSQAVLICVGEGRDRVGVIANKSHHATTPEEKYKVVPYADLYIDAGFASRDEALAAGVDIGTPVVYRPQVAGAFRQPHRRHIGRRPRRLRRHRRGGAGIAQAAQAPDHPFRVFGAGGVQPARRGDGRAGAASPTSRSSSTCCSPPTRPTWAIAAMSGWAPGRR